MDRPRRPLLPQHLPARSDFVKQDVLRLLRDAEQSSNELVRLCFVQPVPCCCLNDLVIELDRRRYLRRSSQRVGGRLSDSRLSLPCFEAGNLCRKCLVDASGNHYPSGIVIPLYRVSKISSRKLNPFRKYSQGKTDTPNYLSYQAVFTGLMKRLSSRGRKLPDCEAKTASWNLTAH